MMHKCLKPQAWYDTVAGNCDRMVKLFVLTYPWVKVACEIHDPYTKRVTRPQTLILQLLCSLFIAKVIKLKA